MVERSADSTKTDVVDGEGVGAVPLAPCSKSGPRRRAPGWRGPVLLSLLAHAALGALVWREVTLEPPPEPVRVAWEVESVPDLDALAQEPQQEEEAPSPLEAPAELPIAEDQVESPPVDPTEKPEADEESLSRLPDPVREMNAQEMAARVLKRRAPPQKPLLPTPPESPPAPTPMRTKAQPAPAPSPGPLPAASKKKVTTKAARPHLARNAAPTYPPKAERRGWEGRVHLRLLIDRSGSVADVRIEKGSGYALLDDAARDTVLAWTFDPAERNGVPVQEWFKKTIEFRLR